MFHGSASFKLIRVGPIRKKARRAHHGETGSRRTSDRSLRPELWIECHGGSDLHQEPNGPEFPVTAEDFQDLLRLQLIDLEAAILSRIRSPVTSRSNWAKDSRTLSVRRPHRCRRVELLRDSNERDTARVEHFDHLCEVAQRAVNRSTM